MFGILNKLTSQEALVTVEKIIRISNSKDEIERRLVQIGFDPRSVTISSKKHRWRSEMSVFVATVTIQGPNGEIIQARS